MTREFPASLLPEIFWAISGPASTSRAHAGGTGVAAKRRTIQAVAENVGDVIWEVDAKGLYLYMSPAVERILGYPSDELIGKKHFYDLLLRTSGKN